VDDDDKNKTTVLTTGTAGLYKFRGRNGSGDPWDAEKESNEVAIVEVDLDMAHQSDESKEESDGAFLALNDDDDNSNKVEDKLDTGSEPDMSSLSFSISPSVNSGEVKLEKPAGGNKVRVYEDSVRSTQVTLPKTWDLSSESLPSNYYVEGYLESGSLRDIELKLSYIRDSSTCDFDKVKITVIDVDYAEDTMTPDEYGYDSYTNGVHGMPYKSVEVGETDTVYADTSGDSSMADEVYFSSTDTPYVTVSPSQASSTHQLVTVTGVSEGFAQVLAELYDPATYDITAASIGACYAYDEDTYTVAVRVVHEDDDDVQDMNVGDSGSSETDVCVSCGDNGKRDTVKSGDDVYSGENILVGPDKVCDSTADGTDDLSNDPYTATQLGDYLNDTVYNQAVVSWTVTKLADKDVNFDLNRDGDIDVTSWTTGEMDVVINECKDTNYDYNIFIVDNPSFGSCGYMDFGPWQRYGFVFPDYCWNCVDNTTAHELAHGAFDLPELTTTDTDNLMHQTASCPERLRKGQWTSIHSIPPAP
jgi:hypothetical protein